jgi:hypothetical protein
MWISRKGEAEEIAIANERNVLLILDDALARRHANSSVSRSPVRFGILIKAKVAGHIPTVAPQVSTLTDLGFRLAEQTRETVLKLANEARVSGRGTNAVCRMTGFQLHGPRQFQQPSHAAIAALSLTVEEP